MDKELKLLRQAIMLEEEGYEFYMMASQNADNNDSREALSELAHEEEKHKQWLKEMHQKVKEGATTEFDFKSIEMPSPGLFKWDNVPLDNISKALSVFSIGVKMEYSAIEFYKKAKEDTNDPEIEKLLDVIIDWERKHLNDFQKRYDELQQEWWDEQRFSPS